MILKANKVIAFDGEVTVGILANHMKKLKGIIKIIKKKSIQILELL